jgi:hypothetical protein
LSRLAGRSCSGTEVDQFGAVFRCMTCRCEVDSASVWVEVAATTE